MAQLSGAKLSIIHVVEIAPILDINYDSPSPFNDELYTLLLNNAEQKLAEFANHLKRDTQQQFLEQGDARDEIIRVAEENQIDLIVIGSHGRHGLALLLGSTANAVLHHARCDVLAVRLMDE
jgi:universal stress protein A